MTVDGIEGKVLAITGASRPGGIGLAIAEAFGLEGARVVISDLARPLESFPEYEVPPPEALDQGLEHLRALGIRAEAVACDVTRSEQVDHLVEATVAHFGRLDVFVNNAGLALGMVPLVDVDDLTWSRNMGVMATGTFFGIRAAGRQMLAQGGGGRIINIASQAGKTGWPMLSAYCAAKFAVIGMTQSAALEMGPQGITVNAICPGTVDTPLLELNGGPIDVASRARGITREEARRRQERLIPLRRFATPADVADAAVFLASDRAAFITGEALNVTGGEEVH